MDESLHVVKRFQESFAQFGFGFVPDRGVDFQLLHPGSIEAAPKRFVGDGLRGEVQPLNLLEAKQPWGIIAVARDEGLTAMDYEVQRCVTAPVGTGEQEVQPVPLLLQPQDSCRRSIANQQTRGPSWVGKQTLTFGGT